MYDSVIKGLIIGIAIAAPFGPVAILTIQRGVSHGFRVAWMAGFGATLADMLYGAVAAFGVTSLTNVISHYENWVRGISGAILCVVGLHFLLKQQLKRAKRDLYRDSAKVFFTAFMLNITNPLTLFSLVIILAAAGLGSLHGHYHEAAIATFAIGLGALVWWTLLCWAVSLFKARINEQFFYWVNRISGALFLSFGLLAWVTIRL